MKSMIDNKINVLINFRRAYLDLRDEFERDDLLNTMDSVNLYPFESSFDEYSVVEWIDNSVDELRKLKDTIK